MNRDPSGDRPDEVGLAFAIVDEEERRFAEQRFAAVGKTAEARQVTLRQSQSEGTDRAALLAQLGRLQAAVRHARLVEGQATERAAGAAAKKQELENARLALEAGRQECEAAQTRATQEVSQADATLVRARANVERAGAAFADAAERERTVIAEEDHAQHEMLEAASLLRERSTAREKIEKEVRAMREHVKHFLFEPPSLAIIDEVRFIDARTKEIDEIVQRIALLAETTLGVTS